MLLCSSKENVSHFSAIAEKLGILLTAGTLGERWRVKRYVVIEKNMASRKRAYIILTPLNPTFI